MKGSRWTPGSHAWGPDHGYQHLATDAPSGRREEPMSIGSKLLLVTVAAAWAAPAPPLAWAAKPPLCPGGRFAVAGSPLLGPGGEVVVLENGTFAIGTL